MESLDTDNDDIDQVPRSRAGRAKAAAILTGRVTAGLIGLGVAVVTIGALTILPLPEYAVAPLSSVVAPEAAPEQRVCPGSLLSLASDFAANSISLTSLGVSELVDNRHATGLPAVGLDTPDVPGDGPQTVPVAFSPATATERPLPTGAASQTVAGEFTAGFSAAACAAPAAVTWLAAGSTTTGRTSLLLLANPSAVAAEVEITLYTGTGPLPAVDDVSIAPGSQMVISLASYATDVPSLAVRVASHGGLVQAALQQSITRGLLPGGIELTGTTAPPALRQIIPGVTVRDSAGIAGLLADEANSDVAPVLRLLATGTEDTSVEVGVRPVGDAAEGTALTLALEPGQVVDVPLEGLADGEYTIWVDADQPVIAAARVSTTGTTILPSDLAWFTAAQGLPVDAEIAVASGPAPRLHLVNPTEAPLEITLTGSGVETTVPVPAGSATSVPVTESSILSVRGFEGGVAAITYSGAGALASYPGQPIGAAAPELRVYQ